MGTANRASFRSNRIVTFLVLVLIVTGIIAMPAAVLYENARRLLIGQLANRAVSVAGTVARFIEADIDPYLALIRADFTDPASYDADYYEKMLALFGRIKTDAGADFVFTEIMLSDTEIAYILDGEEPGSELFSPLGSVDGMADTERGTFLRGVAAASGMIEDPEWGVFLTGFAPIRDPADGRVVSVVGVDFSVETEHRAIGRMKILVIVAASLLVMILSIGFNRIIGLRYTAMETDYQTGLFSKHYHEQVLCRLIDEARSTGKPVSLLMADVDYFKQINDRYGHVVGDRVLRAVAEVLRENTRSADRCSRFGGDEFVALLPDAPMPYALSICERIREKVAEQCVRADNGDPVAITLSIGVAEWAEGMDADDLTACADSAMYLSKNSGKNKVTPYVPTPRTGSPPW